MQSFTYAIATDIVFGLDAIDQLPAKLAERGFGRRILLVTDPGIMATDIPHKVQMRLERAGYLVRVFHQVQANPRDTDCLLGVEMYLKHHADGIVAVGGGSAMDTAKAIGLLSRHGGSPADYADGRRPYGETPPIACVPTTAGTGSEVTRSSVITESTTHRKMTLKHEWLRPTLAVLDPTLTFTVPRHITAATGVDALVHAIEGYTCKKTQPISQAFGAQAMRLIYSSLVRAFREPVDQEARSNMLLGSLLAGLCFGSADVAGVHCLAEALGGLYDTPHGIANAVFLLPVLRYNVDADIPLHASVARHLCVASSDDDDDRAVSHMIERLATWLEQLEIPALGALPGVSRSDDQRIIDLALANSSTESNVKLLDEEAYRRILEEAYQPLS